MSTCPDIALIDALAHGDTIDPATSAHINSCADCQARLRAARDDAALLGRARQLVGSELGPPGAPRIPGYRPIAIVRSGAQGVVYKAVQESTSRLVAIKALGSSDDDPSGSGTRRRHRAEREVEIIAKLRHPSIVTVHESRTLWDGRIALVMEFVDGVALDQWQPPGDTPAQRLRAKLRVLIDACHAVHYAHLNGVIHRDLKPDNILVTSEGHPVVLDFGIAKLEGPGATITGEFAGTPAYASPEQVAGKPDDVDALTDVYSLGVILYRLITGAMPYEVEGSIFEMARIIASEPPLPPRQRDASISSDLEAVTLRALSKDKATRYHSAAELARELGRVLAGEPVDARSGSGWYVLRKAVVLNRRRLALIGLLALVLIGAGAVVLISLARTDEARREAQLRQEQARAEQVRARAVTELLREALPSADPDRPELATLIGNGLNRLYYRIETGAFADEPEVEQELRRLWGGVYTGFGPKAVALIEYAEVSLRTGLNRLRQRAGASDARSPEIASTIHQLAGVVLVRKRYPEAQALAQQALDMRAAMLAPGAMELADSHALLARTLLAQQDSRGAREHAEAALKVLDAHPPRAVELPRAAMLALRARLAMDAGDFSAAEPDALDALRLRLHGLPAQDAELHASMADAGELAEKLPSGKLAALLAPIYASDTVSARARMTQDIPLLASSNYGYLRGAYRVPEPNTTRPRVDPLRRLIALHEATLSDKSGSLINLLLELVRAAESEARQDIRAVAAERAADLLERSFGPDHPGVQLCLDDASVSYIFAGNPKHAVELARRVMAIVERADPRTRDRLMAANTRRFLSWFLLHADKPDEARDEALAAIAEFEPAVGPRHHVVGTTRAMLALSYLALNDPRAQEQSRLALEIALASPACPPDQLAAIHFTRARVLWLMASTGDPALRREQLTQALASHERAWQLFYWILHQGLQYTWCDQILADSQAIARELGDDDALKRWQERVPRGRKAP